MGIDPTSLQSRVALSPLSTSSHSAKKNQAKQEAEQEAEMTRARNQARAETEQIRSQASLEEIKDQGYEDLRTLKKKLAHEAEQIRKQGEREIARVKSNYKSQTEAEEQKGEKSLQDVRQFYGKQLYSDNLNKGFQIQESKAYAEQQIADAKAENEQHIKDAFKAYASNFDRVKTQTENARVTAEERFATSLTDTLENQRQAIEQLYKSATDKINEIRAETSTKLADYGTRQGDPFYRLVDLGGQLRDEGDGYTLIAQIPPHEQSGVSVSIVGDTLVVTGTRRNDESLTLEDGTTTSSMAFQTYRQEFPLEEPVDPRLLKRQFFGDELHISVPKKKRSLDYKVHTAAPKFPKGIA